MVAVFEPHRAEVERAVREPRRAEEGEQNGDRDDCPALVFA